MTEFLFSDPWALVFMGAFLGGLAWWAKRTEQTESRPHKSEEEAETDAEEGQSGDV